MKISLACQIVVLCFAAAGASGVNAADLIEIEFELDAGQYDRVDVPVCLPIKLDIPVREVRSASIRGPVARLPAQVTGPGLLATDPSTNAETHFIVPLLRAGEKRTLKVHILTDTEQSPNRPHFKWTNTPGKQAELSLGERPVLRYMYEKLDPSTEARRDETIKPYHHVFDPEGDTIITKGPGGQFTHHRGLFFGFNRITYGGNKPVDVWHCRNGESQQHVQILSEEAGPVLGRHRMKIEWRGTKDDTFAIEERELTAYNTPGGTLIEFAARVTTTGGDVKLDGDPQHAGFHFRASNEVSAKTARQTYYLRPDGQDKPGATRNWPQNKKHVDLPWNAMSFVVGGQRYTALYLDKPTNPKEARFSERDYGRFGSYFEYTITKEKPLAVSYRVWVQRGELTGEKAAAHDKNFDEPTKVALK